MARLLTADERAELLEDIAKAEPYALDDPIIYCLDGEQDSARMMATIAKKLLDEDDKLRKEQGGNTSERV